jgi:hypothetical protein
MSIAKKCLDLTGLFEAELLLELMLRYWEHPLASNEQFRQNLLERAAEVLRSSVRGQQLMEDVPPSEMNFVAAVWYAEWSWLLDLPKNRQGRRRTWLKRLRRAMPSCFCDPKRLP